MDIHPPSGHVQSVRDFVIHLSMITIGILIALGLEQSVETWHHHELGVQARENILSEIRDNKREIDQSLSIEKENKAKLQRSLETIRQLLETHPKHIEAELSVNVNGADLNSVSWTTAQATGALGYMGYDEAKRFAKAYELQGMIQHIQEANFRAAADGLTAMTYAMGRKEGPTDDQLKAAEREMMNCISGLTVWEQIAAQLSAEYGRVLKGN